MTEERAKRKLAAILSADVKGYSRLMEEDELATVRTLEAYREMITEVVRNYSGRVVDSPGDNLLAEFASVVDAVECAVEIQKELKEKNEDLPENRRMLFRIGINLGDVIEEGERIYGDGVNIAARIEGLATGGGICISGTVFDHIEGKLGLQFEYLGEQSVKNIKKPVRVYRAKMASRVSDFVIGRELPLPDKPSIAVLPFVNMSGDPTQEYIGDGFSENIISTLSISSKMFVIARNSTFSYKGKAVKVQQVAEEMGVQYVLEGSVQKSGERLRVTAQLIDALSGHHLWSDKYDRKLIELFDLQDEITKKIVTSLQVKLTHGEAARWAERTTENFEAWSCFVRGRELYMKFGKEDNAKARELLEAATELDPDYAYAWGVLGGTHLMDAWRGWSESPSNSMKLGRDYVKKSLELDERSPVGHGLLGHLYLMQGEHEKALAEHKKTLSFHPNHDMAHFDLGATMCFSGRFEESIELIEKAMRLSPYYPAIYLYFLGINYVSLKRFEEAIEIFSQLNERCQKGDLPTWYAYRGLAECYWERGRKEEAREYLAKLLKSNPKWSLESLKMDPFPFKDPVLVQPRIEIFRKLGAPEKPNLPLPDKPSIAVLPFVNMSNDPEQEYFSDGITEEIISALAKLEGMKVISRTSVFCFKGKDVGLQTIGNKLRVNNVLEGSVRKAGNRLRITAQLINVANDSHIWSETFDRELKDVFAIQEDISQAIVNKFKVEIQDKEKEKLVKSSTDNQQSYDLCLKGMFSWNKGEPQEAIGYFDQSITLDPKNAHAYAMLATTYIHISLYSPFPAKESYEKAKAAALKALEIDNMLADAHIAVGVVKMAYEYDWGGAEEALCRSIELNPGLGRAHQYYSLYHFAMGQSDKAIAALERALELDPLSTFINSVMGMGFLWERQYEKAIEYLQRALEITPRYPPTIANLGMTYAKKGDYEEAISTLLEGAKLFPENPFLISALGCAYGLAGKKGEAQKIVDRFIEISKKGYFSPMFISRVYAGMGDVDKAIDWLEKAYEDRDPVLYLIKSVPSHDYMHSDSRFVALLKKMGLED